MPAFADRGLFIANGGDVTFDRPNLAQPEFVGVAWLENVPLAELDQSGGSVRAEFVHCKAVHCECSVTRGGDHDARHSFLPLEQFAHQLFGRFGIAANSHQHIQKNRPDRLHTTTNVSCRES